MEKVMLWEPDRDLRKALSLYIGNLGYKSVALNRLTDFNDAIELERPLVCLLPADLAIGKRVSFTQMNYKFDVKGVISVVLPDFSTVGNGDSGISGIVIDTIRKPFGIKELAGCLDATKERKDKLESFPFPWEQSLEVRTLQSVEELREALKLRYEVYREVGFMETSDYGLDLDPFDFKSTIFGAFITSGGQRELVGTIRIIQDTGFGPHKEHISRIMTEYGIDALAAQAGAINASLPALSTFRLNNHDCKKLYTGFADTTSRSGAHVSDQVHELSRLVISRKHRRNRGGIERRLYELVIAHCCASTPSRNWFVIAVHPSKTRKYLRFGFQNISQLGIESYTGIDQPAALMVWDLHRYLQLPNPFTSGLEENIVEYGYRNSLQSVMEERSVAMGTSGS